MDDELFQAAKKMIEKLEEMGSSESLSSVFTIAHIHGCEYDGPTWSVELAELKNAVEKWRLMNCN